MNEIAIAMVTLTPREHMGRIESLYVQGDHMERIRELLNEGYKIVACNWWHSDTLVYTLVKEPNQ